MALAAFDSDGFELCWSEAQNLGTPKHPCIRASESQISSVCPGLAQLPGAPRTPCSPLQSYPFNNKGASSPAQLQICPNVARRVALVDFQRLQLLQKALLELFRAVDEDHLPLESGECLAGPGCLGVGPEPSWGTQLRAPNVVNYVPEPVGREACLPLFPVGGQNEFGGCGDATAAWENRPEGPEREGGTLVCFEEPPAFVGSAPTCQQSSWKKLVL